MGYEERVKEILNTLNSTGTDGADPLSAVWIEKYQSDIRFLLKELADCRGRGRILNQDLDKAKQLTESNLLRIKELQDRVAQAINILSGSKTSGDSNGPNT